MSVHCSTVIIILVSLNSVINFPVTSKVPTFKVLEFLKRFGYINEDDATSEALYTEEGIADVIKSVQKFGALSQTGIIDNATLKLMSSPRCGVPDIIKDKRQKRYLFGSNGWNKRTLTYFIANWAPHIGKQLVKKNFKLALNTWSEYGRLTFKEISTPDADIIVAFASGYHGDRQPFDGPGNILAHAFYPYEEQGFGGDIHFDADEKWIDSQQEKHSDGMDFLTVALHELGHSLGLSHSDVPTSVMFPYYQEYDIGRPLHLGYDDVLAMYELYIRREITSDQVVSTTIEQNENKEESSTSMDYEENNKFTDIPKHHDSKHNVSPTSTPSLPNICNGHFDSVAVLREEIFIFKEQYVWRLKEMAKIEEGYPLLISQMFPNFPKSIKKIDAAYENPDGMIVLFAGNKFWVFDGKNFTEDSPKLLVYYGLPSTIEEIDAVLVWAKNGKTYFFKQELFWRYNESTQKMDEGYPKHIQRWRGVPPNLDAATTWKGITYFFKNEFYWKFDNDWVTVTEQSPLPTAQLWLGCPEDDLALLLENNNSSRLN